MHLLRRMAPVVALLLAASPAFAATETVSPKAYEIFQIPGTSIAITNSILTTWVFALVIIIGLRLLVGRPKLVPTKGQAVVESMISGVRGIVEPIVGERMIKHTFPLLICLFTFILINNWSGLLPGVGAFGLMEHGHLLYFFRPANADLNTTLALAIICFFAWAYFVLRYAGLKVLILDLFGNKADKREVPGVIYMLLTVIFLGVGVIEVISILFRIVSLSCRLFGNVFGGESLLTAMTSMAPWFVPVPFYFIEVLIGLIQAFVFTLLVSVYIGLICNHEGGHEAEHGHGH